MSARVSEVIPGLGRPVSYFPQIARFLGGDVSAAVFMCQFMYWRSKVGQRQIYKTRDEIEAETAIAHDAQRRICRALQKRGYLEVVKKGLPARNFYVWDWRQIDDDYADFAKAATTSSGESPALEVGIADDKYQGTQSTTSETTAETTTEREWQPSPETNRIAVTFNELTGRNEICYPEHGRQITAIWNEMERWGLASDADRLAAFEAVIRQKARQWGNDAKMSSSLTMRTLFRDPVRFNAYLNDTEEYAKLHAGEGSKDDRCPYCLISGGRHAESCLTLQEVQP